MFKYCINFQLVSGIPPHHLHHIRRNLASPSMKSLRTSLDKSIEKVFKKVTGVHNKLGLIDKLKSEKLAVVEKELELWTRKLTDLRNLRDESLISTDDCVVALTARAERYGVTIPMLKSKDIKVVPVIASCSSPRLPYHKFYSENNTCIKVGKTAIDNDELSTSLEHRHNNNWWLHVSGCPGSHVVIVSEDDNLPTSHPEVLRDAAVLTVFHSKGNHNGKAVVSYVRCGQVSKPQGVRAGAVLVTGAVKCMTVHMQQEALRLGRLLATKTK